MRRSSTILIVIVAMVALATVGAAGSDSSVENSNSRAVPTGAVMFFDLSQCPKGWSAFGDGQGRAIVGGSPGVTVGSPLASGEDRSHNHVWSVYDVADWSTFNQSGGVRPLVDWDDGIHNDGRGFFPLGIWGQITGSMSNWTDGANTSDVMPYLQLLTCVKK